MHTRDARGILWIGDPHIASRRPGRRLDADYGETSLGKLEQSIAIANAHDLVPVILGDLFTYAREDRHDLVVRTMRTCRSGRHKPLTVVGTHDRDGPRLTDNTALALLREADVLDVIVDSGAAGLWTINGHRIGIGGTPSGQDIPTDIRGLFGPDEPAATVWITHHDLAFDDPYPNCIELHEIAGCIMAVNGHIHGRKPIVRKGATKWFNPGSLTRQSIDAREHQPMVWGWVPGEPKLRPFAIEHKSDVFDMAGHLVEPVSLDASEDFDSLFVDLMRTEAAGEVARTSDGAALVEEMGKLFEGLEVESDVQAIIADLHRRVVARENGQVVSTR